MFALLNSSTTRLYLQSEISVRGKNGRTLQSQYYKAGASFLRGTDLGLKGKVLNIWALDHIF